MLGTPRKSSGIRRRSYRLLGIPRDYWEYTGNLEHLKNSALIRPLEELLQYKRSTLRGVLPVLLKPRVLQVQLVLLVLPVLLVQLVQLVQLVPLVPQVLLVSH